MHRKTLLALSAVVLTALGPVQAAEEKGEEKKSGRFLIGPQLGFFTPNGGLVRSRFGSAWTNVGFGFGDVSSRSRGELSFDVNLMSSRGSQSEVFLAPIGLVYRKSVSETQKVRPYVGASANLLVSSISSNLQIDPIQRGFRTGVGGSLFGGVTVGKRFFIEGRYYGFSKIRGFDFSGTNVAIGWRL